MTYASSFCGGVLSFSFLSRPYIIIYWGFSLIADCWLYPYLEFLWFLALLAVFSINSYTFKILHFFLLNVTENTALIDYCIQIYIHLNRVLRMSLARRPILFY